MSQNFKCRIKCKDKTCDVKLKVKHYYDADPKLNHVCKFLDVLCPSWELVSGLSPVTIKPYEGLKPKEEPVSDFCACICARCGVALYIGVKGKYCYTCGEKGVLKSNKCHKPKTKGEHIYLPVGGKVICVDCCTEHIKRSK